MIYRLIGLASFGYGIAAFWLPPNKIASIAGCLGLGFLLLLLSRFTAVRDREQGIITLVRNSDIKEIRRKLRGSGKGD